MLGKFINHTVKKCADYLVLPYLLHTANEMKNGKIAFNFNDLEKRSSKFLGYVNRYDDIARLFINAAKTKEINKKQYLKERKQLYKFLNEIN